MARNYVLLENGERYHLFNRGVDKRDVFLDKNDYIRFYMSLEVFNTADPSHNFELAKNKVRTDQDRIVKVLAYSLLPNHFHLLVEQLKDNGISNFMKRVLGGYTSYFNEKYKRSGVLFQGRYKRVHVDSEEYYQYLFAYVNENHYVHSFQREHDVIYSSAVHYSKESLSKVIGSDVNIGSYNADEAMQLARSIAKRREIAKLEI